jgi:high-affinity Fe2+/Pb2+ permease
VRAPRLRSLLAAGAATALGLAPGAALACSVCMSGRDDETRAAFLATTGLLTALPLLMVGGLVWWLRRRARQLDAAEAGAAADVEALSRTSASR